MHSDFWNQRMEKASKFLGFLKNCSQEWFKILFCKEEALPTCMVIVFCATTIYIGRLVMVEVFILALIVVILSLVVFLTWANFARLEVQYRKYCKSLKKEQ